MARRARVSWPGGVFHVTSRFAGDHWWLDREGAREAYLELLARAVSNSDVKVLAYCLMSNHVHLVLVQGERPLERFIKSLHIGFSAWLRKQPKGAKARNGSIFADRPRSVLIERGRYLLELIRYIHNNPVRAGVVRHARRSDWTSHRACIGAVDAPAWLDVSYVHENGVRNAHKRFDRFVDAERHGERRPELSGLVHANETAAIREELGETYRVSDRLLGRAAFVTRMRASTSAERRHKASRHATSPTPRAVFDATCRHMGITRAEVLAHPRSQRAASAKRLTIWLWLAIYGGRQIDIARALSLDSSIVSRYYGQALHAADEHQRHVRSVQLLLRRR